MAQSYWGWDPTETSFMSDAVTQKWLTATIVLQGRQRVNYLALLLRNQVIAQSGSVLKSLRHYPQSA
jgi:hypothetical protein